MVNIFNLLLYMYKVVYMVVEVVQSFDTNKLILLQEFIDLKLHRNATSIAFENGIHFFKSAKLTLQDVISVLESRDIKYEQGLNKINLLRS